MMHAKDFAVPVDELDDAISDAIDDSMDMDWTSRYGARAVISAFEREGWSVTIAREVSATAIDDLVERFAVALKEKLHAAEAKYGHGDAWMRDDWRDHLIRQLGEHVKKGDPRDVAAYCAFAWHHGWSLTPRHEAPAEGAGEREEIARIIDPAPFREGRNSLASSSMRADAFEKAEAILALRTRSSAPEARDD